MVLRGCDLSFEMFSPAQFLFPLKTWETVLLQSQKLLALVFGSMKNQSTEENSQQYKVHTYSLTKYVVLSF